MALHSVTDEVVGWKYQKVIEEFQSRSGVWAGGITGYMDRPMSQVRKGVRDRRVVCCAGAERPRRGAVNTPFLIREETLKGREGVLQAPGLRRGPAGLDWRTGRHGAGGSGWEAGQVPDPVGRRGHPREQQAETFGQEAESKLSSGHLSSLGLLSSLCSLSRCPPPQRTEG